MKFCEVLDMTIWEDTLDHDLLSSLPVIIAEARNI